MYRKCSKILTSQIVSMMLLLFSLAAVNAAESFEVNATPLLWRITPEEVAAYNITVTNLNSEERIYSISLKSGDATNWILSPNFIKVPANSTSSEVLNIFPKTTTSVGNYLLDVTLKYGGDIEVVPLQINMNFEGFSLDYVPNVALKISVPEVQDPRQIMRVSVLMTNKNMLDMKNLTLRIRSDLFFKEINTSLGPKKDRTGEFLVDIDPLQSPGLYKIYAELYYPITDKVVSEAESEFKIDTYSSSPLKRNHTSSWFMVKDVISVENIGNYEIVKETTARTHWYERMFTSTDPDTEVVRVDGKSYFQWNPSVKPMEVKTLVITKNYRLLILVLLLLLLAVISYYIFRSPIILLKEAHVLEQDDHGISEIKIKVFVKNRSRTPLEHITITDKVPGITDYVESSNLGSMRPSRITKTTAKGTILHWDLDKLDAFEERIITYRLKSKLKIVGDMSLPKTRVKFTYGAGKRERFVISPDPLFFSKHK